MKTKSTKTKSTKTKSTVFKINPKTIKPTKPYYKYTFNIGNEYHTPFELFKPKTKPKTILSFMVESRLN
jgi:hypothetical protein